jgi:hypothetical protein
VFGLGANSTGEPQKGVGCSPFFSTPGPIRPGVMTKRISVALVFLVGCATGGAASQLVVPKATAQQAATLPTYEYHCQEYGPREIQAVANKLGGEGWKVVAVDKALTWCFERQKM